MFFAMAACCYASLFYLMLTPLRRHMLRRHAEPFFALLIVHVIAVIEAKAWQAPLMFRFLPPYLLMMATLSY